MQLNCLNRQIDFAEFDTGLIQKIRDHPDETISVHLDTNQILFLLGGERPRQTVQHVLHKPFDGGQRRPQFMRYLLTGTSIQPPSFNCSLALSRSIQPPVQFFCTLAYLVFKPTMSSSTLR
jgi:hypothetical protein